MWKESRGDSIVDSVLRGLFGLRKIFKLFLIFFQIAVAALLIALGAFFWRLHKGPININPYIPYLIQASSSSDSVADISIESAQMRWGGIRHPIDFDLTNFKAFDEDNRLILSVPQMSFSFSLNALMHGVIAPRTIAIYRPYLHLQINQEGELKEAEEEKQGFSLKTMFRLLKREEHLTEFSLVEAALKITDTLHGAEWSLPDVNLTYSRRFRKNHLNGSLAVQMKNNKLLMINLNGRWKGKGKELVFAINIDDLDLTNSLAAQKYPYLKNFTTPVSLAINTEIDALPLMNGNSLTDWREAIDKIDFEITGGEGIVNLPDPVIARYNFSRFKLNGSWYGSANNFDISNFRLILQNGGKAWGNFSVSGIGEAVDARSWDKIQATLNAEAINIPMDMLPDYWPASIGPDVHAWVKENLKGGLITDAQFALHFSGLKNESGVDADKVDGTVNVIDTQVSYMDGMPVINAVSGNVRLTRDKITITVSKGHTDSILIADGGTLTFLDLTKPVSSAALDLNLSGNVRDILTVLDAPPLKLAADMGIKPQKTTGTAQGNLQLFFPVGDAFQSADQIKIKANADVRNADIEDIALGYGLQDAILRLELNDRDLSLNGTALFYTSTAKYSVFQSFDKSKEITSDIRLHIDLNERARDYMEYPLFTPPALCGVLQTDLHLTMKKDGSGFLEITADLTDADIDIREIGWVKPSKTPGKAVMHLTMNNGQPLSMPLIELTDADNTYIRGNINFNQAGQIDQIHADPIHTGRTKAGLSVRFLPDQTISFDLNGSELDLSGLLSKGVSFSDSEHSREETDDTAPNLLFQAAIDKLWLSKDGFSENNSFSAHYQSGWKKMNVAGYIGQQKVPLLLSLTPTAEKNKYAVSMTSQDAGYILKALDYISTVKGGNLKLNGIYTFPDTSRGTVEISDFYLEEQQIFTRLLMLTSLTGIIDTLRGEGLFFDKAEIPYTTDKESLTVYDAVISGASLGITLNGKYYRRTGYLNLRGSLIPFYTLNSLLGKIPLIGKIFSGEKGGGLIAPTYTIKGKLPAPDISVNAFSALAPGAIRSLFGKLSDNDQDLSLEEEEQESAPNSPPEPEHYEPLDPSDQTEFTDVLLHHSNKKTTRETEFTDILHHEPAAR